jgi:hypothetical protein
MAWRNRPVSMGPVSILLRGYAVGTADPVGAATVAALMLSAACVALTPTAPVIGDQQNLSKEEQFGSVLNGSAYVKAADFGLTGDLGTEDGTQGIHILRPACPVAPAERRIGIDRPLAGQRVEGTADP